MKYYATSHIVISTAVQQCRTLAVVHIIPVIPPALLTFHIFPSLTGKLRELPFFFPILASMIKNQAAQASSSLSFSKPLIRLELGSRKLAEALQWTCSLNNHDLNSFCCDGATIHHTRVTICILMHKGLSMCGITHVMVLG